ncbi:MAG: stage II sporulation protein R [Clostridia bacterium]|nr:stage II sporulation protein R [Clostridia bacterium]
MNKTAYKLIVLLLLVSAAACFFTLYEPPPEKEYIRIHIRANSNSEADQSVKHIVKEKVIAYLTPLLAETESKEEAQGVITDCLGEITARASRALNADGAPYGASAKLCREEFPARAYGDLVLEKGVYDALIITLGEGQGDNWWCVAFPPLCFVEGSEARYKSKILEIIHNAKNSN